ncbi:MAG: alpha/beta fold hydrolase [Anaerolineae bacterium]|nr:alpha/beta fold hydrolase [Anaerolineae bacterium]
MTALDQLYVRCIGVYEFEAGRRLLLTRKGSGETAIYFYAEGTKLTHLLPISETALTTAHGETIRLEEAASAILLERDGHQQIGRRAHEYDEEQVLIVTEEGHTLAGCLLKPLTPAPHPAVLFCHLANVHERDYYRLYAQHLVKRGIAVLLYDKRGRGSSGGEALGSQIYELSEDADAVFRFLRQHPAVDPQRIGLWGMSNGGWVDLLVASKYPDVMWIINLSAAGVAPTRQELVRRLNVSRQAGATPDQLQFLASFWQLVFSFLTGAVWSEEVEAALTRLQQEPQWRALLQDTGGDWLLDTGIDEIKREYRGAWRDGGFDPIPLYAQLHCPILCLWGENDDVLPLEESVGNIRRALRSSDHSDWSIRTFPTADHLFYLAGGSMDSWSDGQAAADIHLPEEVFTIMADWAKARV